MIFVYTAFTLYGPLFHAGSTNHQIGNSTVAGPTTPTASKKEIKPLETRAVNRFFHIDPRDRFVRARIRVRFWLESPFRMQKVWAVPISLATTFGIEVSFFSSRY